MPARVLVRRDKANGSACPDVVGTPNPTTHLTLSFFERYILWKQNTNYWLKELVIMEPTRLSNYIGLFLNIVANISSKEKVGATEVVHSGNLLTCPKSVCRLGVYN